MHFIKSLVLSTTAFAILGYAACYDSGETANNAALIALQEDDTLETICSTLIGDYKSGERRLNCADADGRKIDFMLHNIKDKGKGSTSKIELAECKNGIKKELACERGGKSKYTHWEYSYDK
jgi:hypothetical protein